MRDIHFVAVHRGGQLTRDNQRRLIRWARECSEHVLPLFNGTPDYRLLYALRIARDWETGNAATGDAMKASVAAHAVARESSDIASIAVARSIGHTVATAHMADHSLGGALYALRAVFYSGKSVEEEREWQIKQLKELPPGLAELVIDTMTLKEKHFKIF